MYERKSSPHHMAATTATCRPARQASRSAVAGRAARRRSPSARPRPARRGELDAPCSSWKASKIAKREGPMRTANQAVVCSSCSTTGNAPRRSAATWSSLSGFASNSTKSPIAAMFRSPGWRASEIETHATSRRRVATKSHLSGTPRSLGARSRGRRARRARHTTHPASARIVDEVERMLCRLLDGDHDAHPIGAAARKWRACVVDRNRIHVAAASSGRTWTTRPWIAAMR